MTEAIERIKDLQYSFSGFLWKCLFEIHTAWDEGEESKALWRATVLVNYLPNAIKSKLKKDVKTIQEKCRQAQGATGHDFHSSLLIKNKTTTRVAQIYLPPFIDKMMRLLDDRGYLEKGLFKQVSESDFKQLEEKENEDQMGSGQ